jgi:transcriptional regulator with XRE-family HTH domain
MARLKRQPTEWREVIRPVLGVLLVESEPLGLRHIRQIIGVDDDRLRDAIERLGGLVTRDWQRRYSLFHLKLSEYLCPDERHPEYIFAPDEPEYIFAPDEEESWHKRLAQWCEGSNISTIWQDVKHDVIEQRRCEYARQHYLTHLYHAHEWQRLFEVLDAVQYGKAKIRDDPSTRSYAHDLDLGQQAAIWEGWTVKDGITLLPRLWRYTLLRCSLTSRADQYPLVAFRLLVLLGRKQEALGLAELLTKPANKVRALLQIAEQAREQPNQERDWLATLLLRASEIARTIERGEAQAEVLERLGMALVQAQQWERAEAVIHLIEDHEAQARALGELGMALAQAWQCGRAEAVWVEGQALIGTIEDHEAQARAWGKLAATMAPVGAHEQLLRLIQRSWLLASTREDALRLFSLATEFIPHDPKLGLALYDAFTWVDTFLKG